MESLPVLSKPRQNESDHVSPTAHQIGHGTPVGLGHGQGLFRIFFDDFDSHKMLAESISEQTHGERKITEKEKGAAKLTEKALHLGIDFDAVHATSNGVVP
jgi:hypothetical protein